MIEAFREAAEYVEANSHLYATGSNRTSTGLANLKNDSCLNEKNGVCTCTVLSGYTANHKKSLIYVGDATHKVHIDPDTGKILCDKINYTWHPDSEFKGVIIRYGKCRKDHWSILSGRGDSYEEVIKDYNE